MQRAILDYDMTQDGDRIPVAISGGPGSFCLLRLLSGLQTEVPNRISIRAVYLTFRYISEILKCRGMFEGGRPPSRVTA